MNNPKIGIRPTIDGRRGGIRESLEDQTMGMAQAAAKLISDNLKYADGTPVQCVIADTTIGGGAEAGACAEKFSKENVIGTLTVTPCWCYGSETMDLSSGTVKAVWGFNGTERPGAVYLAAVLAAHAQRGLPAFGIYGRDVRDIGDAGIPDDVREKILRFARAAIAVGQMKDKAYVGVGSVSMGIAGSFCDPAFFQKYLGIRAEWVDMTEILRRVELGIFDHGEYQKALAWTKANCKEGFDINEESRRFTPEQKAEQWEFVVKMTLILKDILLGNPKLAEMGFAEEAAGRNAIAGGFQGQRQWTDYKPNGDFSEAILTSTFDWNGKKRPTILATENDGLNGVSMLFTHLLDGGASVFADVRTYWSPDAVERVAGWKPDGKAENGFIHLINSGAAALDGSGGAKGGDGGSVMKPWWEMTDADIAGCLAKTQWCPGNNGYFRGGGFSSKFETEGEMPVTMLRVNLVAGLGPVMQIAEGYTVDLPAEVNHTLLYRTDPAWPSTWFAPILTGEGAFTDVYSVMANWGANHGAFCYGHRGADLITLCAMLRIPVSLHNVPDEKIFRPHAWSAFGTAEKEAADYRACAAYGPLYR
ncbi:MAG: L-fucose isomerase [Oscillospiraceae bacterium]|jgi:L-fucose isomerase|nr:L-fucose isomerase [Oscillospiraceae bacterium]